MNESSPPQPCRRHVGGNEPIGRACDYCGHQDTLHPGFPNPGLDACLACVVGVLFHLLLRSTPTLPDDVPHLGASDA